MLAAGNGLSTVMSFLSIVLFARALDASSFAALNLVLVLANLVAQAGSGFDASSVRVLARGDGVSGPQAVTWATSWRVLVTLVGLPLAAAFFAFGRAHSSQATALSGVWMLAALAVAFQVMALSIIVPTATHLTAAYTWRQVAVYLPQLLVASALAVGVLPARLLVPAVVAASLTSLLLLVPTLARTRVSLGTRDYRHIAAALSLNVGLFAVFERLDLLLVARWFGDEDLAQYSAAVRVAGGLVILTSAFAVYSSPRASAVTDVAELGRAWRQLRGPASMVLAASLVAAACAPVVVPVVFGPQYHLAGWLTTILILQYPVVILYQPASVAFTFIGRRRWLLEAPVILICLEFLFIWLVPRNVVWVAFASTVAHLGGLAYVLYRVRVLRGWEKNGIRV